MTDLATRLAYDLTRTAVVTRAALPVASVAAARAVSQPADGTVMVTAGRSSTGDGGGGSWVWDSSSTDDDDGSLTLAISGVTTGRWRRQYTGPVDVRWFGAVGDGTTANDSAFSAAIAALDAAGGGELFVPTGVYKFAAALDLGTAPKTIRGDGWATRVAAARGHASWTTSAIDGTVLWFPAAGGVQVSGNEHTVRDLAVLGPGDAADSTGVELGSAKVRNHIENVLAANFQYGVNTLQSESSSMSRVSGIGCDVGIRIVGTDMSCCDGYASACSSAGIYVAAFGARLFRCVSQGNTGRGVIIAGPSEGVTVDGCWFEQNLGSIELDATSSGLKSVTVSNSRGSDVDAIAFTGSEQIGGLRFGPGALFQSSTLTIPSNVQGVQIDKDSSFFSVANSSPNAIVPHELETVLHYTSSSDPWELAASLGIDAGKACEYAVDAIAVDAATGTKVASWRNLRATYYRRTGQAAVAVGSEIGQQSPTVSSTGAGTMSLWAVKAGGSGLTLVIQVAGLSAESVHWTISVRRRDVS